MNSSPLAEFGFKEEKDSSLGGRPVYQTSTLLKLHTYGYMNKIQSSPQLEKNVIENWKSPSIWVSLHRITTLSQTLEKTIPMRLRKFFRATVQPA